MLPSTVVGYPGSAFNNFLYAAVGDDNNGMVLTVLSALARQNVDPWEEAADLSRLPRETARTKLVAMLGALPGQSSLVDRTAIAGRLIPLLPRHSETSGAGEGDMQSMLVAKRSLHPRDLSLMLVYLALMLFGQWVLSDSPATPSEASAVAAPLSPAVAPAPSSTSPAPRGS